MKYRLCEIVDITMGQSPKSEFYNTEKKGLPFLQGNRTFGFKYPTFDTYTTVMTKFAKAGDVIMSVRAPVGELNITPVDMCLGRGVCSLRMKNGNQSFLFYMMKYYVSHLIKKENGTVFGSVNRDDINGLEVDIPDDIEEQKKIARFLEMIDDKIELNNEINKNLEEQAQAIFKSWFVDFEPFGGIQPSEMQFIPLQELCKVVTKGTTPTTLGKSFTSTGINFIKAESILDNHSIDSSKFAFIDEETNALLKRSVIKANDIVFTIAGTLGRFAMVDNSVLPANTNQAVAIIRPDETKVTPAYLYSFFIGNWHNEYYSKRIQQAVQANLSLTTIKSLPIAVLKNTTMNNYDKLVSPLFALMKSNEEENRRLSKLRDTLLPRLMSGELDVSNLDL